jgi:hypothetical protein
MKPNQIWKNWQMRPCPFPKFDMEDGGPAVVSLSPLSPRADLRDMVEEPSGLVLEIIF